MEDIEPLGFVMAEDSGNHRIDKGLHGSVGDGNEQCAPVKVGKSRGAKGEHQRDGVADDGKHRDGLVADLINDEAKEDDAERKGPHACAIDLALLQLAQVKAFLEIADRRGANPKDE